MMAWIRNASAETLSASGAWKALGRLERQVENAAQISDEEGSGWGEQLPRLVDGARETSQKDAALPCGLATLTPHFKNPRFCASPCCLPT